MSSITRKQSRILQRLVRTDGKNINIAQQVGVSIGTVVNYRNMCFSVDAMPEEVRSEMRRLWLCKIPLAQIAARLRVPIEAVRGLHRLELAHQETASVTQCKECGEMVFPPSDEREPVPRKKLRGHISQNNVRMLCDIVLDLVQLGDLRLITNPLFHHLTQRAEKVYGKIHGTTKKKSPRQAGTGNSPRDQK